jgi:UPF0716 protein FxsA
MHGLFVLLIRRFALITPGLLTDAIGFSMLVPQIREIYVRIAKRIIREKLEKGQWQMRKNTNFR